MGISSLFRAPFPDAVTIDLASGPVAVSVRANARATRYRLSLSARGEPALTIPRGGNWRDARAFLDRHSGWLEARIAKNDGGYGLFAGGLIPLRGVDHEIASRDVSRGSIEIVDGENGPVLLVPGGPAHLRRRLTDWLKAEARADLEPACARYADILGVRIAGLKLRDQSTRWGSCSSARVLNFNWRLVLAPSHVLDYVAAHEVAHILEMNHAPAFWKEVGRAMPDYEAGKAWLKRNGGRLMAIR